jgi:TonB family protein
VRDLRIFLAFLLIITVLHGLLLSLSQNSVIKPSPVGKVSIVLVGQKTKPQNLKAENKRSLPSSKNEQKIESKTTTLSQSEIDSYLALLLKHLENFVSYPKMSRRLNEEGSVVVRITILETQTLTYSIIEPSQHTRLNDSVLNGLEKAKPFPRPPKKFFKMSFDHEFKFAL